MKAPPAAAAPTSARGRTARTAAAREREEVSPDGPRSAAGGRGCANCTLAAALEGPEEVSAAAAVAAAAMSGLCVGGTQVESRNVSTALEGEGGGVG